MDGNETRSLNLDGQKVRRLRKIQGVEMGDFAEIIGVTPAYVSHLETNRRKPSPTVFKAICDALRIAERDRGQLLLADEAGAA
jgi:transcriptional regulator with XRE-family HTH domain